MKVILSLFFIWMFSFANAQNTVNQPEENFEFFWKLFQDNYAFFEEKNINWDSMYQVYRPQITATTPDSTLFNRMSEMLAPFNDSHVNLIDKKMGEHFSAKPPSRIMEVLKPYKKKHKTFKKMTDSTLKAQGFAPMQELGSESRGSRLFSYTNNGKVAYLRINRCYSRMLWMKGSFLNKQLNKIFKSFEGMEALIIDVRLNPGGTDSFSQAVAGRIVDKKVIAFHKQTRINSTTFGPLETHYIKPKGKKAFQKPVYLLTNDKSTSAADVLALMMSKLEQVTIIGENSNGSYSDIYAKKLPNKWIVTLSNQRYLNI